MSILSDGLHCWECLTDLSRIENPPYLKDNESGFVYRFCSVAHRNTFADAVGMRLL